jgi:hypothetical protein
VNHFRKNIGVLAALFFMQPFGCNVGETRVSGVGIPCSTDSQCTNNEVCFLGECRGSSNALSRVLAEVRPPPGSGFGILQTAGIDLRQSVLVDFTVPPALSVSGAVLQLLGPLPSGGSSPVSGASVTFAARGHVIPDRAMQVQAQATSGGLFAARLPPGAWDATVVPPAPLPPIFNALGLTYSSSSLQFLLPSAGLLVRVQGKIVAGAVPLAGARVLAVDANNALLAAAATADATGTFQLVLPPDAPSFYLRVGPASDATGAGGVAATLFPNYAAVGPFAAGGGATAYDFGQLPAAVALSGTVLDASGHAVIGARVYALSLDGQGYVLSSSTLTDGAGAYQLALLTGKFAVEAAPINGIDSPSLSSEQDVTLTAPALNLPIRCPARVTVHGTILQSNGKPAPAGTQISATRMPDRLVTGRVAQTQPTDVMGNFTLLADAGTYRISIAPPAGSGLASKLVEIDLEASTSALPALQLSQPLQVVGTIAGTTNSGLSAPIAGATVEFFALDATGLESFSLGSGLTDRAGHYSAFLPDVARPDERSLTRR